MTKSVRERKKDKKQLKEPNRALDRPTLHQLFHVNHLYSPVLSTCTHVQVQGNQFVQCFPLQSFISRSLVLEDYPGFVPFCQSQWKFTYRKSSYRRPGFYQYKTTLNPQPVSGTRLVSQVQNMVPGGHDC